MSKNAPTTNVRTSINAVKEEGSESPKVEKEKVKKGSKPGLASHLAAKRTLDAAIQELSMSGDGDAVKLLNVYSKNLAYRMRQWAKVEVKYVEE